MNLRASTFLVLSLSRFFNVSLASFSSQVIEQVDPALSIIDLALELGFELEGQEFDMFVEESLQDNREVYESLYLQLPGAFEDNQTYTDACESLVFDYGTLRENDLIQFLVAAMRHGDIALFETGLMLAADNLGRIQGGENFDRFIFEITCPLTPPKFLSAYLKAGACDHGLATALDRRMNLLNPGHGDVFRQFCSKHIEDDLNELLAPTLQAKKEFIEIVELDGDKQVESDSIIKKMSLNRFEVVYSIAGVDGCDLSLDENMSYNEIIAAFHETSSPSVELAGLVIDKSTKKGTLLKTPGIYGPFFAILECAGDECDLIPESNSLFLAQKSPIGQINVSHFDLKENQVFVGLPKNYVKANAFTLNAEAPFWFSGKPDNEADVLRAFKMNLENKGNKFKTCVAYSLLNLEPVAAPSS